MTCFDVSEALVLAPVCFPVAVLRRVKPMTFHDDGSSNILWANWGLGEASVRAGPALMNPDLRPLTAEGKRRCSSSASLSSAGSGNMGKAEVIVSVRPPWKLCLGKVAGQR